MPPTRALAVLAAASLSVLTACGDDDSTDVGTEDDTTQTETDDDSGDGGSDAADGDITVEGTFGESADISVPGGFAAPAELVTEDLIAGDGDEVPAGATVTVHYKGVLLDGTEFDASYGGQPVTFPLSGVIEGWTEGIPGMRVGGRRLLVIPPDLAYGPTGQGPIGPDETLVFVVDMVELAG